VSNTDQSKMKTFRIKGKVFCGRGEGAKFIDLRWVRKQIKEKLGIIPYPGTLNIKVTEGNAELKKFLKRAKPIEILPVTGFCRGRCFKAYLMNNLECVIVIPEIVSYPKNILEVIAPINLREKLQLKDGDVVEAKIPF